MCYWVLKKICRQWLHFSQIYHCSIRWRMAYEFFFSILYYVHCTVFKQSKSTFTELSTIYNRNVGHWFSNPLSREAIVFCYSVSLYRMLIVWLTMVFVWVHIFRLALKTFAFIQTNFILFLVTFSTIFLTLPFLKNVFCLWNKAIYYRHKLLSNVAICHSLNIHSIDIYTAINFF